MNQTAPEKRFNEEIVIPFELISNKIYLQVSVNKSEPLAFILDTGAANSLISLERIEELNLKTLSKIPVGGAGNAEVFGHIIESANAAVIGLNDFVVPIQVVFPFAELSGFEGKQVDGVLGYEFFSHFAVEIDYEEKLLRLYNKTSFKYSGKGTRIPLDFKHNHPHLQAEIYLADGESVVGDFVVDTGSGLSLTLTKPFTETNELLEKSLQKIKTPTGIGVGGITQGFVGRFEGLKLGDFKVNNPIVSFMMDENGVFATSDFFEGNIGGDILKKFKVIFDYENKVMILEKNSSFERLQNYDTGGIFLALEKGEIKVMGLTEDSPATEAMIEVGDALTELDGLPISQFSLSQIREKLKAEGQIILKIKRGIEVLEKKLELRKLV
jgi:predicted aspartyl protease